MYDRTYFNSSDDYFDWDCELGQVVLTIVLDNGWECRDIEDNREKVIGIGGRRGVVQFWSPGIGEWGDYYDPSLLDVISDIGFAKALFGEEKWVNCVTEFIVSVDKKEYIQSHVLTKCGDASE